MRLDFAVACSFDIRYDVRSVVVCVNYVHVWVGLLEDVVHVDIGVDSCGIGIAEESIGYIRSRVRRSHARLNSTGFILRWRLGLCVLPVKWILVRHGERRLIPAVGQGE